jgi:hypothetical protein
MSRGYWVYVGGRAGNKPPPAEKAAITAACEKLINQVLKPRFLEKRRHPKLNYPVDIYGKWHGNKYRFTTRFRYADPDPREPEFDAPFARLEYVSRDHFDLSYHRHTGEWLPIFQRVSLKKALKLIQDDSHFWPC